MDTHSIVDEPVRGTFGDVSQFRMHGLDAARKYAQGEFPMPPLHHLTGLTPTQVGLG
ncbi:MAG: hypothetical protein GWN07_40830, partial [Actinobacteria bacterium]|nr:hypothetical protein [Actinomycetota bacterium]NIS35954.1 hypothetical protein [Actinomycetota bacterium]NIU70551.1 hypothetical protein [Actinomycetota bacterium]NIW32454.1 hypothetical protein [Actinomycetota bacterium]NIX25820.1 hypothetical protein [Actinomycetota bacterium]